MRPFLVLIEQIFPVITAENEISTDEEEIRQMAKIGSQKVPQINFLNLENILEGH